MVVPSERPLAESAAELVAMLGDPRPHIRDGIAYPLLSAWLSAGAFDETLAAIGDGVVPGLSRHLGNDGDDSVYRRSYSALVLAHIIGRDNDCELLTPEIVLRWGDAASSWFTRERDHRGRVNGWAHSIAHGADVLTACASSRHFGDEELTVLLDVIADRLIEPTHYVWHAAEADRLAFAATAVLYRNTLDVSTVHTWLHRLGEALCRDGTAAPARHNTSDFLRALQLQLAIGVNNRAELCGNTALFATQPHDRGDIVLAVLDHIRKCAPELYRGD